MICNMSNFTRFCIILSTNLVLVGKLNCLMIMLLQIDGWEIFDGNYFLEWLKKRLNPRFLIKIFHMFWINVSVGIVVSWRTELSMVLSVVSLSWPYLKLANWSNNSKCTFQKFLLSFWEIWQYRIMIFLCMNPNGVNPN